METISRDLEALLAFHAVAQAGGFTRAAEGLGTSKAMLSKLVKRLEASTRTQLFHRTTRTLNLTEPGQALYAYSQKIFALSEEASRHLRDLTRDATGLVRLSMPVSFGEVFAPEFLSSMQTVLPKMKFEMDLSNENRDFFKGELDFAIRASEDHHPDLIARHLGRLKDVICVSPVWLKSKQSKKLTEDPRSLVGLECIHSTLDPAWNTWTLVSDKDEVRVETQGRYSTNQYGAIRSLCLAGMGVARLPYYHVIDDLRAGTLMRLFDRYQIATHSLFLVYLQSEYVSAKHSATKDALLSWFKVRRDMFVGQ